MLENDPSEDGNPGFHTAFTSKWACLFPIVRIPQETQAQGPDLLLARHWQKTHEAHASFRKARELDPDNTHADYWAGGFDVDGAAGPEGKPTD